MDFGARLERLRQLQRERDAHSGRSDAAAVAAALGGSERIAAQPCDAGQSAPYGPELALELSPVATQCGTGFVHECALPMSQTQGHCPLAGACCISDEAWALLGGQRAGEQAEDRLSATAFIDVETTGLAGGTGVVAFLVGVARVVDGDLVMRQFFLRDFGEEAALLAAVDSALTGVRTIVTYNGKIFDWPLLETRCVMNRMRFSAPVTGHIDLVFPARRIWQHHLPDRRLSTVEQYILGHERVGDVPGELIPAIYFGYQRSGDARPLQPVLEHNRFDILSLVALLGVVGGALSDPLHCSLTHANEFHGLGRWCLDLGLVDDGVRCLEKASRDDLAPAARERVLRDLAATYKRLKRRQNAVAVWRELVNDGALSVLPYIELAKHHEHAQRDYAAALALVDRAVELHLSHSHGGSGRAGRELQELLHRRQRLQRKVERVSEPDRA